MSSLNIDIVNGIFQKLQQNKSEYDVLIESGTLGGQTIINLQPHFRTLHTIELSEYYFNYFDNLKNENEYENVVNHFGDTSKVLPEILKTLSTRNRVIFWLDGHWSSGNTAKGEKDCPLIEECVSIDNLYLADKGVILIDDYRLFGTHHAEDWTDITLESITKCFTKHKVNHSVSGDVLILTIEK